MPGFDPSDILEYYVVRRDTDYERKNSDVDRAYLITKFHDKREPSDTGLVYRRKNGSWYSDDYGFRRHGNENASKRIALVKKHISLGEPDLSAYWIDKSGRIEFHTIPMIQFEKSKSISKSRSS